MRLGVVVVVARELEDEGVVHHVQDALVRARVRVKGEG